MENKKISKPAREIVPEPTLKAPPPTPCTIPHHRSGSVPDVRIVDKKKGKKRNSRSPTPISIPVMVIDFDYKSTSEHLICLSKGCGSGTCTSNLLHSVRQRLLNL